MKLTWPTDSLSRTGEGEGEGDRAWSDFLISTPNVARGRSIARAWIGRAAQLLKNALHHSLNVGEHLVVSESQYPEPLRMQKLSALPVKLDSLRVLPAIELDHQTMLHAAEVDDEGADGLLAPELCCAELAGAQSRRRWSARRHGEQVQRSGYAWSPSPWPSPIRGREPMCVGRWQTQRRSWLRVLRALRGWRAAFSATTWAGVSG
jgi:hypothetical protein